MKAINNLPSTQSKNSLILSVPSRVSQCFNLLTKELSGPRKALAVPNAYSF